MPKAMPEQKSDSDPVINVTREWGKEERGKKLGFRRG